jgi:hypothetical protein
LSSPWRSSTPRTARDQKRGLRAWRPGLVRFNVHR